MWEYFKKFFAVILVIGLFVGFIALIIYGKYAIATSDLPDWVKFFLLR
jgi:uncharacterized membrane protein YcaP (DUF421 family)